MTDVNLRLLDLRRAYDRRKRPKLTDVKRPFSTSENKSDPKQYKIKKMKMTAEQWPNDMAGDVVDDVALLSSSQNKIPSSIKIPKLP